MTRWRRETAPAFDRASRKLDPTVLRRVRAYLDVLCELDDPRARGKPLHGDLADFWRFRIGDYRVIAAIADARLVIVAVGTGHNSELFRR